MLPDVNGSRIIALKLLSAIAEGLFLPVDSATLGEAYRLPLSVVLSAGGGSYTNGSGLLLSLKEFAIDDNTVERKFGTRITGAYAKRDSSGILKDTVLTLQEVYDGGNDINDNGWTLSISPDGISGVKQSDPTKNFFIGNNLLTLNNRSFRNNVGVLQYQDVDGDWQDVGSGGGTPPDLSGYVPYGTDGFPQATHDVDLGGHGLTLSSLTANDENGNTLASIGFRGNSGNIETSNSDATISGIMQPSTIIFSNFEDNRSGGIELVNYSNGNLEIPNLNGGAATIAVTLNPDGSINAIPLTGTEVDKPVTGDIEMAFDDNNYFHKRIFSTSDQTIQYLEFDPDNVLTVLGIKKKNDNTKYSEIHLGIGTFEFQMTDENGINSSFIKSLEGLFYNDDNPGSKGLTSGRYYGENYDENAYVQAKYVDDFRKHPITAGNTPTISDSTPGNLDSITISGTDAALSFTVVISAGQSVNGSLCTITYAAPWAVMPRVLISCNSSSASMYSFEADAVDVSYINVTANLPNPGTYKFTIFSMQ